MMEQIRQSDFSRLDGGDHVYLDHTGAALYPQPLLDQHHGTLSTSLLGNPHSGNPTSSLSTDRIAQTRLRILSFFNADPLQYTVIFTHNASHALKLVGEAFPFHKSSTFALLADNHNSVVGIREYARRKRAAVRYLPLTACLEADDAVHHLSLNGRPAARLRRAQKVHRHPSLFAYPAQSNFSGVRHPLSLVAAARRMGWHVLLDAAAYAATSRLDLAAAPADFVALSFYKLFGYPTGVGALLVRHAALAILKRPWFAGGTVKFVTTSIAGDRHALCDGAEGFEDGTLNFTAIPAIAAGLDYLARVGMTRIRDHVASLTAQLLATLRDAAWPDGRAKTVVYGPSASGDGGAHGARGGTVAFDLLTPRGERVDARLVEDAANKANISLRVGCFCNPGAAERALKLDGRQIEKCLHHVGSEMSICAMSQCVGKGYLGCVRASLGLSSNGRDIERFGAFVEEFCSRLQSGHLEENRSARGNVLGVKFATTLCFPREGTVVESEIDSDVGSVEYKMDLEEYASKMKMDKPKFGTPACHACTEV